MLKTVQRKGFTLKSIISRLGVNVVDEVGNAELKECLTLVKVITPVSDVPVLRRIVSWVSAEKRTEEIVGGGRVNLHFGGDQNDASMQWRIVGRTGRGGDAEKIDVELNNGSSADLQIVEPEIVGGADSMDSSQGVCGPKEVAGWSTAIAEGCTLVLRVCWGSGWHKGIGKVGPPRVTPCHALWKVL